MNAERKAVNVHTIKNLTIVQYVNIQYLLLTIGLFFMYKYSYENFKYVVLINFC